MIRIDAVSHDFGIPGVAYNEKADKRSWEHMKQWLAEAFGTK